jgi:large subunit ribosomal protein L13
MVYTIDAEGRSLGRVATEAASVLMGKNDINFKRNVAPDVKVKIINSSKVKMTRKKLKQKEYANYSGYPGGLKMQTLENLVSKKGYGEAVRKAVRGMLPSNKLRPIMMKNLLTEE